MAKRVKSVATSDAGFTLVELIVTIIIMGIIFGPLALGFTALLRNTNVNYQRLLNSHDAQMAANYIVADAQNGDGLQTAGVFDTSLSDTASCPDPSPPVSGTPSAVVRFNWVSTPASGTPTAAFISNYVLIPNAGSSPASKSLLRRFCKNGSLVSDLVVGRSLASLSVTCNDSPNHNCTATSPAATSVGVNATEILAPTESTSYQYSLAGTFRRVSESTGGGSTGTPPTPPPSVTLPLILLGTGGMTLSGNGQINVNNGDSIAVNGPGTVNGGGPTVGVKFNPAGTSTGTVYSPQTCSGSKCPPYTPTPAPASDPYQFLATPTVTGLPAHSGCTGGVALPGTYASDPMITGHCLLASGTYVFQNGLTVNDGGTLGVVPGGGVFIYITGGSITLNGTGTMTLAAQTTGTYANIAIFQARNDSSPIFINGTGALTLASGAVLYAPAAQLRFVGNGSGLTAGQVVVSSVVFVGNGNLAVG